jgi:hypothetical protein
MFKSAAYLINNNQMLSGENCNFSFLKKVDNLFDVPSNVFFALKKGESICVMAREW